MKNMESKTPIERAKELTNAKARENKLKEELEREEENARLETFYSKVASLYDEFENIRTEEGTLTQKGNELAIKIRNVVSGERQALETLKSSKDTLPYLKDDEKNIDQHHSERREGFEQVFGDVQKEKMLSKKELKEVEKDQQTVSEKKAVILSAIEGLKKDPQWEKVTEKKKNEFLQVRQERDIFYRDEQKAKELGLYNALTNVNNFSKKYEQEINTLKNELTKSLRELLEKEQGIFSNAKQSAEYQPKVFGEVTFDKYLELLPKSVDEITFSIYSRDQSVLTFPQFDYSSPLAKELQNDIEEVNTQLNIAKSEVYNRNGIFSGRAKFEKQVTILQKKKNFLHKILDSFYKHVKDFNDKHLDVLIAFGGSRDYTGNYNNFGYTVGRYVGGISNDAYALESDSTFPKYNRTTTTNELFKWGKQNEIPQESKKTYDERSHIDSKMSQLLKEYGQLAGEDAMRRLQYQ